MFKEFKVKDIFTLVVGKQPVVKDRFSKPDNGLIPAITGVTVNNGYGFYTTKEGKKTYKNILTISKDGEYAGTVYLQDEEVYLAGHSMGLIPKMFIDNDCLIYIASLFVNYLRLGYWKINAQIPSVTDEKMDGVFISLPVIKNPNPNHKYTVEDIDWQYMRERIKELERERIKELDAYLKVTGLNDYELNDEDKAVLCISDEKYIEEFVGDVIWKKVKIGNMFEKCDLKRIKKTFNKSEDISKEKTEEYSIPLVNAKHGNNGIMYYGRKTDWETTTFAIDIVNDGAISTGDVYPQPQETGVLYNAYLIKCKEEITDEKILLFLAPVIEKVIKDKFGYDNKAFWEKVKEEEIELPFDSNGNLHKLYIYIYIRAIEKTIIKEMIFWKDRQLEILREVV